MSAYHTQKDLYSQYIFPFWKLPGETLAVMLERFRQEKNLSTEEKLTYAGRLDPMAEGIVPILVGDARFQKDTLLGLEKVYELTVLLGASTDSADMLGMVKRSESVVLEEDHIQRVVRNLVSIKELPYPMYSSRPVEGKPLFMHARAGNMVEVPVKKVSIKNIDLKNIERTTFGMCLMATIPVIQTVVGDFRQSEIIETWQEQTMDTPVTLVTFSVTASSGTYMRSLAEKMGESLGVPALAYRIVRTSVGEYKK